MWIRKDYDSPSHSVAGLEREPIPVMDGEWEWRAKTVCGRTITGRSGESGFPPECGNCRRSLKY